MDMARRLADLGLIMLICSGILSHYKNWLTGKGLMVVDCFGLSERGRTPGRLMPDHISFFVNGRSSSS